MTHGQQRDAAISFFVNAQSKFYSDGIELITLKGSDYAPEKVAMTEVFFTAADISTSADQVLWVHVRKHLSAIANYMSGQELRSEDIRSRLLDVANYMALIDSYIANRSGWLYHLWMMIETEEFPNRPPEDVERLKNWIAFQYGRYGIYPRPFEPSQA